MCRVDRKRNRYSSVAGKKMSGESFSALFYTRQTVDRPWIVGSLHHRKAWRQTERFIHAKTVVVDDTVATVGTINFDYRSYFLHFENGEWLYNATVTNCLMFLTLISSFII